MIRIHSDFKFSIKLYHLFLDCRIAQWNKILEKIKMRPLEWSTSSSNFFLPTFANLFIVFKASIPARRQGTKAWYKLCCPHLHIIHDHSGLYAHVSERKSGFHIWSLTSQTSTTKHYWNFHLISSQRARTSPVKFCEKTQTLPLSLHLPWPFLQYYLRPHFLSAQFFLICSWSSGQKP